MQFRRWFGLKLGKNRKPSSPLYRSVLSGALNQDLYIRQLAEDTFNGRFEQLALHGALVMRHLREHGAAGRSAAQQLHEEIFSGIDHAYRETGVSDATIARKVRGSGERFLGLARGLDAALNDDGPDALSDFVERNGLGGASPITLADYLRRADKRLREQLEKSALSEDIDWPESLAEGF